MTVYNLEVPTGAGVAITVTSLTAEELADFGTNSTPIEDGSSWSHKVKYMSGDSRYDLILSDSRRYDARKDMTFNSIRLSGVVSKTDALGDVTTLPIESVISWNHSGRHLNDTAHAVKMVSLLFGFFAQPNAGAITDVIVDVFDHDVVNLSTFL